MTPNQKINFPIVIITFIVILCVSFHYVQRNDMAQVASISVQRPLTDCNKAEKLVHEEEKAAELFKPKIVYYNRVGKCGSRSLLSAISKSSKDVRIDKSLCCYKKVFCEGKINLSFGHPIPSKGNVNFVSETPLYTKFDEKELQNNVTSQDLPLFYTRHIYFTNFTERYLYY